MIKKILKGKKGFTLIEIIVVLVIIAILAAASVPTMMGYIDEARGKAMLAEARLASQSVQAAYIEVLAITGTAPDITTGNQFNTSDTEGKQAHDKLDALLKGTGVAISNITFNFKDDALNSLIYANDGYFIKLDPGETPVIQRGGTKPDLTSNA